MRCKSWNSNWVLRYSRCKKATGQYHWPVPVVASRRELASIATNPDALQGRLPKVRRVITHDTSVSDITRSAGLSSDGKHFYVQNIDQKVEAIRAGIGVGHLPRLRIQNQLNNGELVELALNKVSVFEYYLAWKISHKGKGLQLLTQKLAAVFGETFISN